MPKISVAMTPGSTMVTRTPKAFISWAGIRLPPQARILRMNRLPAAPRKPASHRCDVDNAAGPSFSHAGHHGLNAAHRSKVVGLHGRAKCGDRGLLNGAPPAMPVLFTSTSIRPLQRGCWQTHCGPTRRNRHRALRCDAADVRAQRSHLALRCLVRMWREAEAIAKGSEKMELRQTRFRSRVILANVVRNAVVKILTCVVKGVRATDLSMTPDQEPKRRITAAMMSSSIPCFARRLVSESRA